MAVTPQLSLALDVKTEVEVKGGCWGRGLYVHKSWAHAEGFTFGCYGYTCCVPNTVLEAPSTKGMVGVVSLLYREGNCVCRRSHCSKFTGGVDLGSVPIHPWTLPCIALVRRLPPFAFWVALGISSSGGFSTRSWILLSLPLPCTCAPGVLLGGVLPTGCKLASRARAHASCQHRGQRGCGWL